MLQLRNITGVALATAETNHETFMKSLDSNPWQALFGEAMSGAHLAGSPLHGESHWRAVAAVGLELNRLVPSSNPSLLLAFGMLHDCRRRNDDYDPEHGARAADMALESIPLRDILSIDQIETLAYACLWHEKGRVERNQHDVGLCWDSDRYNLLRLGIDPDRRLLSAPISEEQHFELIDVAEQIWRNPPEWEAMIARFPQDAALEP